MNAETSKHEKNVAALNSVWAAVFLTGLKAVTGLLTGSLGILAEAAHSGLDLAAALVTCLAVRAASKPADREHAYGHGKVENLSALAEMLLLLATCAWIIHNSVQRLGSGRVHVDASVWAFVVMAISIAVDFSRSRMLYRAAAKHRSQALEADALHFHTDIWSSSVVIVSAQLGFRSVQALLDATPPGEIEKIKSRVEAIENVFDCHAVRVRRSGPHYFVDLHITLDGELPLQAAHAMTERVEQVVNEILPDADVTVHPEPKPVPAAPSPAQDKPGPG